MKRNTLYTVNKWNKPAFMQNIYEDGGNIDDTNIFGIAKADNPFSKQVMSGGLKSMANTSIGGGIVGGLSSAVGGLAYKGISGGLDSGAGSAVNKIGGTVGGVVGKVNPLLGAAITVGSGIIGGGINALVGTSVDQKKLSAANAGTSAYNNFVSNAETFDAIQGPVAQQNVQNAYRGGVFKKGWASRRNEALKQERADARSWAYRGIDNNIYNIADDQMNDALYNFKSFGGPLKKCYSYGGPLGFSPGALGIMQNDKYLDAINNRSAAIMGKPTYGNIATTQPTQFAEGGSMGFGLLDGFSSDPIGTMVRYQQNLDKEEAALEAQEEYEARLAENAALQKRLDDLSQGYTNLQNTLANIPTTLTPSLPQATAPQPQEEYTPSVAAPVVTRKSGNPTWDYVEGQLRNSGKFSEAQISGIKSNLERESGMVYDIYGDGGGAFGLGQWHGARQPKDKSLEGQTQHLIDTLTTFDGAMHWLDKDAYNKFQQARTPEEAHYYIAKGYERPRKDILAKLKKESDMSLQKLHSNGGSMNAFEDGGKIEIKHPGRLTALKERTGKTEAELWAEGKPEVRKMITFARNARKWNKAYGGLLNASNNLLAFGGELGTNGTDFKNGLLQVNEGGSHEENPLGGVPMGVDNEGVPNMVQEGETVFNNYVFSNLLEVPEFMGKELGLGSLAKKKKKGKGMSFAEASIKLAKESEQRPNDPLSQAGLQASLSKLAEVQEAERMKKDAQEYNEANAFARGGRMQNVYRRGSSLFIDPRQELLDLPDPGDGRKMTDRSSRGPYSTPTLSGDNTGTTSVSSTDTGITDTRVTVPDSRAPQDTRTPIAGAPSVTTPPLNPNGTSDNGNIPADGNAGTNSGSSVATPPYAKTGPYIPADFTNFSDWVLKGNYNTPGHKLSLYRDIDSITSKAPSELKEYVDNQNPATPASTDPYTYPTWMRYAPVVGLGIASLTDALGLTNRPDYTYADKIEASANRAGFTPNIGFDPIGDYLQYRPMDIWYEQNRMNANARATDRGIMNTSGGNRATAMAGLIANGYNNQVANGSLYRQALEYNDALRRATADFNRGTNMFNAEGAYRAASDNARFQQMARQYQLSGLAQAAALRDAIDQRTSAARSANLSGLFTSLGNIGRENFAMNQINWDRSRRYKGDLSGRSYYDTIDRRRRSRDNDSNG